MAVVYKGDEFFLKGYYPQNNFILLSDSCCSSEIQQGLSKFSVLIYASYKNPFVLHFYLFSCHVFLGPFFGVNNIIVIIDTATCIRFYLFVKSV